MHCHLPTKHSNRSATTVPTLWLTLGCFSLAALFTLQAHPSWWDSQGAIHAQQVVTNGGVVTTNYIPNSNAVASEGQLKQFTSAAVKDLNAGLTGGAGSALTNLVYGWSQDYLTNGYATNTANPARPYKPSDLLAVDVGQVKYIANLVYTRLTNAGYMPVRPSWIPHNTNTDNIVATLGQLKEVFNFDLVAPQVPLNLTVLFGSTQATLSWSDTSTLIENYTISYSTNGGTTWSTLATVAGNVTSTTVTGLTLGTNYSFEVAASNPSGSSAASASDAAPIISLLTPSGATLVP